MLVVAAAEVERLKRGLVDQLAPPRVEVPGIIGGLVAIPS
jgi:hypothetical protein